MQFKKPKFWDNQKVSLWSISLLPFSIIYLLIVWIIRLPSIFRDQKKLPIPVICVGNIYLGGTGKTPLVREIFNITKSFGKNPAFIKKYYDYLFDEIEMLKATGKTYTDKDRYKGILLSHYENHDVAILDDGFQDFSIKPNFTILCFNSNQMIGNGLVFPAGPLRETLNATLRADCILINGDKNLEFEKKLFKINGSKKLHIFYSKYTIKNIEKLNNREITAFAGIGNPSNFFNLLKENNLNIKETFSFPDHHNYTNEDFEKIIRNKSTKVITTEKDYYRLNSDQKKNCEYVEVILEIDNKHKFKEIIRAYL